MVVGGEDLGHARVERVCAMEHGRGLGGIDHRGVVRLVTHQQVGVIVPERGDPLDQQRHGGEASGRLRALPLRVRRELASLADSLCGVT